ncbi:MAG: class I SAM-dependent methyltransferase [Pirellulaceae bacterium]|nr:class I SAM-dependent methyltransferase [Pirellulaceae bacterium]
MPLPPPSLPIFSDQYELIDFGDGRKLERFGDYRLDRYSPAAEGFSRQKESVWQQADSYYRREEGGQGRWHNERRLPSTWPLSFGKLTFLLKKTDFGHLGLFPEQLTNWQWIYQTLLTFREQEKRPARVLNLFAYTGGSTLAAALAGAEVTHVDGAKNVVTWARENSKLSALADAPIRWLTEDCTKFVARERRRGNRYDAIILDPPTYGHGPKGQPWKIEEHLSPLLENLGAILSTKVALFLLTWHSKTISRRSLNDQLTKTIPLDRFQQPTFSPLQIPSRYGAALPSGQQVSLLGQNLTP